MSFFGSACLGLYIAMVGNVAPAFPKDKVLYIQLIGVQLVAQERLSQK